MDARGTLRRGFVTGLVLIAPLAITVLVARAVYGWLVGIIEPVLGLFLVRTGPVVELVTIVVLVALITLLGIVVGRGLGQYVIVEFDQLMGAIPIVRALYSSARQASNALVGQGHQFERVVLLEWPREGVHTIAFVTDRTPDGIEEYLSGTDADPPYYNVFVPMSPNPMGGFMAVVPDSRVVTTDLSASEGLRLVVTTGLSGEEELPFDRLTAGTGPSRDGG